MGAMMPPSGLKARLARLESALHPPKHLRPELTWADLVMAEHRGIELDLDDYANGELFKRILGESQERSEDGSLETRPE